MPQLDSATDTALAQVTSQRTREMYALYAEGATLEEVGAHFGITRERVRQVFREAGISTRSNTETHTLRHDRLVHQRGEEICAAFSLSKDIDAVSLQLNVPRVIVREIVQSRCPPPKRRRPRARFVRYSTDELLAFLQEAGAAAPGPLSGSAYSSYARERRMSDGRLWPTCQTYVKRFGSWRGALLRAGLPATPRGRSRENRKFSEQDCIQALRVAAKTLGKVPTAAEYSALARSSRGALPSQITLRKRCGTWYQALAKAGL